jgi:hypothetical protein
MQAALNFSTKNAMALKRRILTACGLYMYLHEGCSSSLLMTRISENAVMSVKKDRPRMGKLLVREIG